MRKSLVSLLSAQLLAGCAKPAEELEYFIPEQKKIARKVPLPPECDENLLEKICENYCGEAVLQFNHAGHTQVRIAELTPDQEGILYDQTVIDDAQAPRLHKSFKNGRSPMMHISTTADGFTLVADSLSSQPIIIPIPDEVKMIGNPLWSPDYSSLIFHSQFLNNSDTSTHLFRFDYYNPLFSNAILYPLCFAQNGDSVDAQFSYMENSINNTFTALNYTTIIGQDSKVMFGFSQIDEADPATVLGCGKEPHLPGDIVSKNPRWSNYPELLAFLSPADNSSIWIYNQQSGDMYNLTNAQPGETHSQPRFAHNSNNLVYVNTTADGSSIEVINPYNGEKTALAMHEEHIEPFRANPAWAPDDQYILFSSGGSAEKQHILHMADPQGCDVKTMVVYVWGTVSELDVGYLTQDNPDKPDSPE